MTKIIVCMVISLMSLLVAIGSFLTNDVGSYRAWIQSNKPKIMDSFDSKGHRYKDSRPMGRDMDRPGMKAPPMDDRSEGRPLPPQKEQHEGEKQEQK